MPIESAAADLAGAVPAEDPDRADLLARWERWAPDLERGLEEVYDLAAVLPRVVDVVAAAHAARSSALRAHDRARVLRPDWFQEPGVLGYAAYAERFAGTLQGVRERLPYLRELGVTYLHLMPLLQPRPAPNDGGYAVADYRAVRADLGHMADLAQLCTALHEQGMTLTLDLVLNHVAREHDWAQRARAGQERYRRYFLLFPDRTLPDAYERTLPEVFPDFAPGSFTWDDDAAAWVWTTFNSWQWDLDWTNPDVFCEFAEIVLYLANQGVDCLRLDAIAFVWKRMGTSCQNQPEVHAITQALRAVAHIVAPSVVFKAEAIVGPDQLVRYLGTGAHAGRVSDLAYHNSLMVQLWSALATRDVRLLVQSLSQFPPKATTTAWATYLRCHDDIGWAVADSDAAAVGWDGHAHRVFLSDFYSGAFPGSFARGEVFQANPATGDRRISGSAASLAGLEAALAGNDTAAVDLAIARLLCAHAAVLGFGGIPLLYMGDELGLLNDRDFAAEPAHADDNRWLHRPTMPWDVAEQRHDPRTVAGRMFAGIQRLAQARARLDALHAAVESHVLPSGNDAVLLMLRRHAAGSLVQLYNVSEHEQSVPVDVLSAARITRPVDHLSGAAPRVHEGRVVLPPYAAAWIAEADPQGLVAARI